MKFKISGIIASSILSASAYCADVAVAPTGADDWPNMQNVLNAGNTVVLTPGASYTINQRLNITRSNTGIVIEN